LHRRAGSALAEIVERGNEAHLAARRVAVDGVRVTDPATPAPLSTTVGVMLDPA